MPQDAVVACSTGLAQVVRRMSNGRSLRYFQQGMHLVGSPWGGGGGWGALVGGWAVFLVPPRGCWLGN